MIQVISCYLTDVIMNTLAACDYNECDDVCKDYLLYVEDNCPVVFNNLEYESLWYTLFRICFGEGH